VARAQIRTSRTAIEACWRPCETYQRVLTVVAPPAARRITPPLGRGCGCGQPFAAVPQTALCGAVLCGAAVRCCAVRCFPARLSCLSRCHNTTAARSPARPQQRRASAAARPTTSAPRQRHVSITNGCVFWFHHACSYPIPSPPSQVELPHPCPQRFNMQSNHILSQRQLMSGHSPSSTTAKITLCRKPNSSRGSALNPCAVWRFSISSLQSQRLATTLFQ
jgi:hypothetical protein